VNEESSVSSKHLGTYLNDHLAGSVAALELVEYLSKNYPDTTLEAFFADLHADISADQDVLRDLLRTFEEGESTVRKQARGWSKKSGRAKFGLSEHQVSGTGLLEALEGSRSASPGNNCSGVRCRARQTAMPQLRGPRSTGHLEQRAREQRDRVEEKRLARAREAFRAPASE
jgi:hypothetical protein